MDVQVVQVFCRVLVLLSFDSLECFHKWKERTQTYWPWSVSHSTPLCILTSGKAHKPVYQQPVTSGSWITVWWHEPQHPMASEMGGFSCRKENWKIWAVGPSGLLGSWVNQPCYSAPCCRGKTDFASKLANLKVSWAPLHHPFLPYVTA